MQTYRTIHQLQLSPATPERARELGQIGYMQWLGGLDGRADYRKEAAEALRLARDFAGTTPAIAVFCSLLEQSLRELARPLPLALPRARRRGGAKRRRLSL